MNDNEAKGGITLEIINAWQGTDLTSHAHELAERRPWESDRSPRQQTAHAQDSLASLAQRSFALGFHKGNAAAEHYKAENVRLAAKLVRALVAVEHYANEANWSCTDEYLPDGDGYERARQAIEEIKSL